MQTTSSAYLETHAHGQRKNDVEAPIYVRTGIFVQSFRFINASDVHITGYVWQKYSKSKHAGIVLPHADLRQQFPGAGVVYLGTFYSVMYFVIIAMAANCYLFEETDHFRLIQYRNNLIPKLTYWPLITGILLLLTYWRL